LTANFLAFLLCLIFRYAKNDEGRREGQGRAGAVAREVPVPVVRGDDVLIRVLKTSPCDADVQHLQRRRVGAENA
jgi:hypothetical protein